MAQEKTIILSGTEEKVNISGQNCDIRNDGVDIVYASRNSSVVAGADGVLSVPAGGAAKLLDTGGTVYLLGTGSVQLCGNDYSELVFKVAATSSGGGGTVDDVARAAISTLGGTVDAHTGDDAIHLTAEKAIEAAATAISNANLLINPDFKINQRGKTEYTELGYTVDNWAYIISSTTITTRGTITPESDGLLMVAGGTVLDTHLCQYIEDADRLLAGKTVTISFEISDVTDGAGVVVCQYGWDAVSNDNPLFIRATSDGIYSLTGTWLSSEDTKKSGLMIYTRGTNTSVKIKWIKLELGSVATPFTPPEPATELAKCQRYYYRYAHQNPQSADDKCTIGEAFALTANIVIAVLPIATMRSGVYASVDYNAVQLFVGTETTPVEYSSITVVEQTDSTIQVAFAVTGQTAGTRYRVRLIGSDAHLSLSKEL